MTYIIVEYATPDGTKRTEFRPLGNLDWLEDREWALSEAVKDRRSKEASGCVVDRVFVAEVVE